MASRAVSKKAAGTASVGLALGAGATVLAATGLVLLGRGGSGVGITPVDFSLIEAEAQALVEQGRNTPGDSGDDGFEVFLDATAARFAERTNIPLDPPAPDPEPDPDEIAAAAAAEAAEPQLTPEEAAQRASEAQRERLRSMPSRFRYLGRIRVGGTAIALLASDAGQISIPEGGEATVVLDNNDVPIEVVKVESDKVEVIEATIPRTLEKAQRRATVANGQPGLIGQPNRQNTGRQQLRGPRSAQNDIEDADRNGRIDQADLRQASLQRRDTVQRRLEQMGIEVNGELQYQQWTELERLFRLEDRSQRSRPRPGDFEGGVTSQQYRERLREWTQAINDVRSRIRNIGEEIE
ncbi:MAG: hypothetical protein AAGI17_03705 [Planctomycetota bacterium]